MKLSVWAKEQGISYQATWRMYRDGQLPVPAEKWPTGTIILNPFSAHLADDFPELRWGR